MRGRGCLADPRVRLQLTSSPDLTLAVAQRKEVQALSREDAQQTIFALQGELSDTHKQLAQEWSRSAKLVQRMRTLVGRLERAEVGSLRPR